MLLSSCCHTGGRAELREAGIKAPILVLGSIADDEAELVAKYNLIQTVYSKDIVCMLNALGKEHNRIVPVHIKLDTGMGRIGIRNDRELIDLLEQIKKLSYIDCQGVFTHFSTSDESDKTYTKEQLKIFNEMLHICKSYDIHFKYVHAANSAAIIDCPNTYFNMVRGGIAMYGYYPSDEVELQKVDISPVLEWHTKVMHIKEVKRGDAISYGKTFIAQKPMKIATIPVGYGDGYNRLLSNRGYVLVRGKRVPIVGRICMDQTMIDVTPIEDVSVGMMWCS